MQRRQVGDEVELLVDHADLFGKLPPRAQAGEVLAAQPHRSLARGDLAGDHGEQGRFAAAAGPQERDGIALLNAERERMHGLDAVVALSRALDEDGGRATVPR